ncbi:hypothetical protein R69746_08531 [Paraburkholderia aspalathi]|nr:hypothetical protein R69746_08531 [Paraburkholderia aspalathi]
MFVQGTLLETIGATGDDGLNASRFQMLQDRVRIVGFVGSQTGGFQFAQQRQSFGTVSCLPARQVKASEHTQAIDQRVNLGTQSATRAPDPPGRLFFGRAGSMLVGTHNRTVDENLLKVGVTRQLGEYRMPYLCPRPPGKASVHAIPRSKIGRQISPWAASARDP